MSMADAKIHCSGSPCCDADRAKLRILVESAPDMVAISTHATLELEGDHNSGSVMYFDPAATVDASLISDRLWETLAVSRVKQGYRGDAPADAHFAGKAATLREAFGSGAKPPSALRAAADMRDPKSNTDARPWRAELGGPGSFAGPFYAPNAEDHRRRDYFIVARGTVPQLVQDLKEAIAREAPTYRDLLMNEEWRKRMDNGTYVAERNVQRNLVTAAAACQVSIARMNDVGSKLASPDHALPERAIPEWQQQTYSIAAAMYGGKPVVAMYNGVARVVPAAPVAYVAANPQHGVYAFPISGDAAASTLVPTALHSAQKSTTSIRSVMKTAGWNAEHPIALLVPLALVEYKE